MITSLTSTSVNLPLALGMARHHRLFIDQHDLAHFLVGAFARTKNIFDAARFQFGHGLGRYHPAIGAHAHAVYVETLAQTIDHRQQRLHIGCVAGRHQPLRRFRVLSVS